MKKVVLAMAVSLFSVNVLVAQAATPQQEKMKACNEQAGEKKGDERKAFMKSCLSAKPAEDKKTSQQEKMKACNKQAGEKKGDERKKFMSECLKG